MNPPPDVVVSGTLAADAELSRLRATEARTVLLEKALNNIANPISYLREEAERKGNKLNGNVAAQLSNDATWLKEIARAALKATEKEGG
jgi:hypothetical protein